MMKSILSGLSVMLAIQPHVFAEGTENLDKASVKKMVEELLQSKDQTIVEMDSRLKKLEALTQEQEKVISRLKAENQQVRDKEPLVIPPPTPGIDAPAATTASSQSILEKFFRVPEKTPEQAEEEKTEISGFFDVTAQTKTNDNQAFNLGVVELDLNRILQAGHFSASVALDWFPYAVDPVAQVGAAFVDFHLYDNAIPLRGRIFRDPGFHIQAGQFDLPFASDYQFYAVTDRLTVTPPMTTSRIQQSGRNPANGGFNSTGIRTYGQWENLSYAAYAVDSVFTDGMAVGGRVGYLVNDPYRLHKPTSAPLVDAGLSVLLDMDKTDETTDKVYAADLSLSYENLRLVSEFLLHDSNRDRNDGNPAYNETGYHVTLIADLEEWLNHALYVYSRYQAWDPEYNTVEIDGENYAVNRIEAFSVGLGYRFNNNITLKAEYNDTLGSATLEPYFQSNYGIVQLVGSF